MDDKKYRSEIDGRLINAQKYLTEIIISRQASLSNKKLPPKFWQLPEYQNNYKFTIIKISSLMNIYSEDVVVRALLNEEGKKIYTLKNPRLISIIKKEQSKEVTTLKPVIVKKDTTDKPRQPVKKPNLRDKLSG